MTEPRRDEEFERKYMEMFTPFEETVTDDVFTEDDVANANDRMRQEAAAPAPAGLLREARLGDGPTIGPLTPKQVRILDNRHHRVKNSVLCACGQVWAHCEVHRLVETLHAATGDSEGPGLDAYEATLKARGWLDEYEAETASAMNFGEGAAEERRQWQPCQQTHARGTTHYHRFRERDDLGERDA